MRRALPWIAPLALMPLLATGIWLWQSQAARIWLSDFVAACF